MKWIMPNAWVLLMVLALFSCAKTSEVENLQKQIDELKSDQIATINSQIAGITLSIGNLQTVDNELRGYIQILQQQKDALEEADRNLTTAISDLKTELYGAVSTEKANILAQLESDKNDLLAQISGTQA